MPAILRIRLGCQPTPLLGHAKAPLVAAGEGSTSIRRGLTAKGRGASLFDGYGFSNVEVRRWAWPTSRRYSVPTKAWWAWL
jgi:hypothetical protein